MTLITPWRKLRFNNSKFVNSEILNPQEYKVSIMVLSLSPISVFSSGAANNASTSFSEMDLGMDFNNFGVSTSLEGSFGIMDLKTK